MRFCQCGNIMEKHITPQQEIVFRCSCGETAPAAQDDCLLYEEAERMNDLTKHEIMIENAPYDAARCLVAKSCPQCKIDRITQVFIQGSMVTFYVCDCGYRSAIA
jgi:DNA-directed RNA polymerase subunit M/transcription elongation factor TFIIS